MIFGDKMRRHRNISLHGHNIEVVDCFTYLGDVFSKNISFLQTKKHAVEHSRKVSFCLYRKNRNLDLPIDCQLKLFDNTVLAVFCVRL